jgi:hypothetical protein
VQDLLPTDHELTIDPPDGDGPSIAVARFRDRVIAGRGDTAAAALRDLARQLEAQGRASSGQ